MAEPGTNPDRNPPDTKKERKGRKKGEKKEGGGEKKKDRARKAREAAEKARDLRKAEEEAFKAAGESARKADRPLSPVRDQVPNKWEPTSGAGKWAKRQTTDLKSWYHEMQASAEKANWYVQEKFFYVPQPPHTMAKLAINGARVLYLGVLGVERALMAVEKLFSGTSFKWLPGGKEPEPEVTMPMHDSDPIFKD